MITEIYTPHPLNTWNEYHSAMNICGILQHRRRYNEISDNDEKELNILTERCRAFLQSHGTPELK